MYSIDRITVSQECPVFHGGKYTDPYLLIFTWKSNEINRDLSIEVESIKLLEEGIAENNSHFGKDCFFVLKDIW